MNSNSFSVCRRCGHFFEVENPAPGDKVDLLRCNRCGRTRYIPFEETTALLEQVAAERRSRENFPLEFMGNEMLLDSNGEPRWLWGFYRKLEEYAGECTCGGSFRRHAPPRCPQCGSQDIDTCDAEAELH